MNETNEKETQIKNSDLTEAQSFSEAIASRDSIISEKNETIRILKKELANKEKTISGQIKVIDNEKTARIEAENQVSELKDLKKDSSISGSYKPKTEEEQFAENYQRAKARLSNRTS